MEMDKKKYTHLKKITFFGAFVNIIFGVFKILLGAIYNLQSLVVDGTHTILDILSDFLILISAKLKKENFYENNKLRIVDYIEPIIGIFMSITLFLASCFIIINIAKKIFYLDHVYEDKISFIVFFVLILSIAVNEFLFRIISFVAEKIKSNLLKVNAWHRRSDAFSSLIVFIGVCGEFFGIMYLDVIFAFFLTILLFKSSFIFLKKSLKELPNIL